MDKNQRIIELLSLASEIYGKEISKQVHRFWLDSLGGYNLKNIEDAFASFLKTEKFMPRPSDIINKLTPDIEITAIKAYREVEHQIIVTGSYESVEFKDKIIHSVIMSFGGWIKYCLMLREYTDKDMSFHEKEFIRRYGLYVGRDTEDSPKMLPGSFEAGNRVEGHSEIPRIGEIISKIILRETGVDDD